MPHTNCHFVNFFPFGFSDYAFDFVIYPSLSLCRFVLYNRQGLERCSRRETWFPRKRKGAPSSQETMDREMQGIQGSDIDIWQHLNRKHSYFWLPNIQSELEAGLFFIFAEISFYPQSKPRAWFVLIFFLLSSLPPPFFSSLHAKTEKTRVLTKQPRHWDSLPLLCFCQQFA